MHELSLMADLMRKLNRIAAEQNALRISVVRIKLGAMAHISPDHLREHFSDAARGTVSEGAIVEVELLEDIQDPHAQEILLDSVDVET